MILAVFCFICGYIFYQASFLFRLPSIIIFNPPEKEFVVHQSTIEIQGKVTMESSLTINGQNVNISEGGIFDEKIYLQKGLNIIQLEAKNRLGKVKKKTLRVFYQ